MRIIKFINVLIILQCFTACNYTYSDTTPGLFLLVIPFWLISTVIFGLINSKLQNKFNTKKIPRIICKISLPLLWAFLLFFTWNLESIPYKNYSAIKNGNVISSYKNNVVLVSHQSYKWENINNYACYVSIFQENDDELLNISNINLSKIEKKIMYVNSIDVSDNYIAILLSCGFNNDFIYKNTGKIVILNKIDDQWNFYKLIVPPNQNIKKENRISISLYENRLAVGVPDGISNGCVYIYNLDKKESDPQNTIFPPDTLPYKQELENIYDNHAYHNICNYNKTDFGKKVLLCEEGLFISEPGYNKNYEGNYTIKTVKYSIDENRSYYSPILEPSSETKPIGRVLYYLIVNDEVSLKKSINSIDYSIQEFGTYLKICDDSIFIGEGSSDIYQYDLATIQEGIIKNKISDIEINNTSNSMNYNKNGNIYLWKNEKYIPVSNCFLSELSYYPYPLYISDEFVIFPFLTYKGQRNQNEYVNVYKIFPDDKIELSYVIEINECTKDKMDFNIIKE